MIYLYGAKGHAKVIIETLELENKIIGGLVDDNPSINCLSGYSVSTKIPDGFDLHKDSFIVSIGNNVIRKIIVNELDSNFDMAIHTGANISKSALLGIGTVVMAGVSVNAGSQIGHHVILNTNCSVDHDCVISDFTHLSPNVALAGDVKVGEGTHIGIGAVVIQGIKIGKWCIIGAGAVIIKDVPDYAVVVGNPGKIIRYNEE